MSLIDYSQVNVDVPFYYQPHCKWKHNLLQIKIFRADIEILQISQIFFKVYAKWANAFHPNSNSHKNWPEITRHVFMLKLCAFFISLEFCCCLKSLKSVVLNLFKINFILLKKKIFKVN